MRIASLYSRHIGIVSYSSLSETTLMIARYFAYLHRHAKLMCLYQVGVLLLNIPLNVEE